MRKPICNIAIMAHADAGKTTITEQFLYFSGQTSHPGNVDKGTTQSDYLPVEKERGISVRSSHTSFHWDNIRINLIDTPGHVDFSGDVERMLRVPDGVILVFRLSKEFRHIPKHSGMHCAKDKFLLFSLSTKLTG